MMSSLPFASRVAFAISSADIASMFPCAWSIFSANFSCVTSKCFSAAATNASADANTAISVELPSATLVRSASTRASASVIRCSSRANARSSSART
eukprot:2432770-Rhodomonas_salina.2